MTKKTLPTKLSRGTIRLLEEAILVAKKENKEYNNRYVLCEVLCALVEKKYSGRTLDYQLKRMNMEKTGEVLNAIDLFFYKYPQHLLDLDAASEQESDLNDSSIENEGAENTDLDDTTLNN